MYRVEQYYGEHQLGTKCYQVVMAYYFDANGGQWATAVAHWGPIKNPLRERQTLEAAVGPNAIAQVRKAVSAKVSAKRKRGYGFTTITDSVSGEEVEANPQHYLWAVATLAELKKIMNQDPGFNKSVSEVAERTPNAVRRALEYGDVWGRF